MKMSSAFMLVAALFTLLLSGLIAAEPQRPNIVLILTDDFGYECVAANGCEEYKTPFLDKLAAEGVRYTQCFASPLCTPSRVNLMTGQYNVRNYVKFGILDRSQTTFAHLFKKAGYVTAIAGKWQLGKEADSPHHFGFDQACLWQHTRGKTNGTTSNDTRYPNPNLEINGKPVDYSGGEYGPDVCVDFLCDFIKTNKDKPFFVYCPMILTHCPFDATPDSKDWDPKSFGSKTYKGPGGTDEQKKHFKEMVEYHDKQVGKLIQTLEASGLRDNTLVIFTGDNGTDKPIVTQWNGRKVVGGKGQVSDTGTRVPLIVNWPGHIKPRVEEKELVDFSDILPTLCDAARVPLPAGYPGDGVSLWPTLAGAGPRNKPHVYLWYAGKAWARTIDHGVLLNIKSNKYDYQQFDGHFSAKTVTLDSAGAESKAAFQRLKNVIDELAKTRPKELQSKDSQGDKDEQ